MEGLLISHGGKRYFVRPQILELCAVSDADMEELKKNRDVPEGPIVALQPYKAELSLQELGQAVGGTVSTVRYSTVMCPW